MAAALPQNQSWPQPPNPLYACTRARPPAHTQTLLHTCPPCPPAALGRTPAAAAAPAEPQRAARGPHSPVCVCVCVCVCLFERTAQGGEASVCFCLRGRFVCRRHDRSRGCAAQLQNPPPPSLPPRPGPVRPRTALPPHPPPAAFSPLFQPPLQPPSQPALYTASPNRRAAAPAAP